MIFQSLYQYMKYSPAEVKLLTDLLPGNQVVWPMETLKHKEYSSTTTHRKDKHLTEREQALLVEIPENAFNYIFSYARIESENTLIVNTTSRFNVTTQFKPKFESIVNLKRINDIRYINKFFEAANSKLPVGGLLIDHVETKNLRKERILKKYPKVLNYIYYFLDFILKRLFPKFSITKKLYFLITKGNNRVLTKAETYGRLYSCGFEIISEKNLNGNLHFVARKVEEPLYPKQPSYGPIVRLRRVGKDGKMILVYKLRTMHPYAEFLQKYIYETQGLQKGGKFKRDFRVSTLGRFCRTFWLDEFPMFINLFKRNLKLVGVRPLSKQYFELYTKELQEERIKYKPGIIPPFYADLPETLDEIMESEKKYLELYKQNPLRTDFKYFWKAIYNIIIRHSRSK